MKYEKQESVQGGWVKGADVVSGTSCKLISETKPQQSQFKDKKGNLKMQNVSKIQFEEGDALNININRASLNALVDAFGTESGDWVNKELSAITEKMIVGGKRVTVVYLVPTGYELKEDEEGFIQIVKEGGEVYSEGEEIPTIDVGEEVKGEDIPF